MFMDSGSLMPRSLWGSRPTLDLPQMVGDGVTDCTQAIQAWVNAITVTLSGLVGVVRALRYINVSVNAATVTLTHVSGSVIKLREDGNVDFMPARNMVLDPKQFLLYKPVEADSWTPEEVEARFGKQ